VTIQSVNPATEEPLADFDEFTAAQIDRALDAATDTFEHWRRTSFARRRPDASGGRLPSTAEAPLAALITQEMGKPIAEAEAEVEKCARNCDFYAENAEHFLAEEPAQTDATESYVAFQPLGAVLAIMPWNLPFWQVFRFAAPALMAGNVALLKHASNVPQCALAIEEVFGSTGFPAGAFQTLLVSGAVAETLIEDRRIQAVTHGSYATGAKVAQAAGRAIKKTVLELGGSDPFIVLDDADLEAAADTATRPGTRTPARAASPPSGSLWSKASLMSSSGSSPRERPGSASGTRCCRTPRSDRWRAPTFARLSTARCSAPCSRGRASRQEARLDGRGYFYAPTVLTDVTPDMPAAREETFGPVAAVIRAKDENEALAIANSSQFGLGASLWTRNTARGRELARELQSGSVFVNGMVASDPRLPFGGTKRSGYGRELSEFGIREFVNIQTVWIGPRVDGASAPAPAE
jgi:succinate-semialdehyde dehydrogenase/glutarate-semialdehyde dehydrogenase